MGSTFSGISTALSALYAQRRGLDVAGQNIANANTEGYSRQRLGLQAASGPTTPALHSIWDGAGAGVEVTDITRTRDAFLESRGRTERGQSAYLTSLDGAYRFIEDLTAEPSDTGLQAQLGEFWAGWNDLANNPGEATSRNQIILRGSVVAGELRSAHEGVASMWESVRTNMGTLVDEVNSTAQSIASLNATIQRAQGAGLPVNELADQRDLHVLRLAELTGATSLSRADGTVDVFVAGSTLVAGSTTRDLVLTGAARMDQQAGDPLSLRWVDNNVAIAVGGGELAAGLEITGTVLPGHVAALDQVAGRLADRVNAQHRAGYGLDGVTDRPFFSGTTAASIAVAVTAADHVAASSAPGGVLDTANADLLADLGTKSDSADAVYRGVVASLAVVAQNTGRRADIQTRVTNDVDLARLGTSGVNMDEEMTNMLSYQRAYEAAARLMTAMDEMLDVLINRTGLVGR
jgi:flagellar hook-associated protein 1 FlgK